MGAQVEDQEVGALAEAEEVGAVAQVAVAVDQEEVEVALQAAALWGLVQQEEVVEGAMVV